MLTTLNLPAQMLGDEGVIVVDVQLGALATPARSLGDGQRHNEVSKDHAHEAVPSESIKCKHSFETHRFMPFSMVSSTRVEASCT